MKRVFKLSLILLIMSLVMLNVGKLYADTELSFSVSMQPQPANQNREVVVNVNLSNIQSEKGIMSFGGTLEYDKENLTLVKMEGQNGWETPTEDATYSPIDGRIAITRTGFAKSDETVFKITFKLKEGSKEGEVSLKQISVSDGPGLAKLDGLTIKIMQTDPTASPSPSPSESPEPSQSPSPDPSQTPDPSQSPSPDPSQSPEPSQSPSPDPSESPEPSQSPDVNGGNNIDNTVSGRLPQAGENNIMLIIGIGIVLIVAIFYIRYRMLKKKIGK